MRTFYIFKISNDLAVLTKDTPYNLYKTLEGIYLLDKGSISYGKDLLDQVIVPLDKEKYNKDLYEKNKDNDFYMKFGNTHKIINKYRKEETEIVVKNSHIVLKTNVLSKNIKTFSLYLIYLLVILNLGITFGYLNLSLFKKYSKINLDEVI